MYACFLHLVHPAAAPSEEEKEDGAWTNTHAGHSHMYTISFFSVKALGHRSRLCSDRAGTKITTTAENRNTTQCHILSLYLPRWNIIHVHVLKMFHVHVRTHICSKTSSNIHSKSSNCEEYSIFLGLIIDTFNFWTKNPEINHNPFF